MRRWIAILAIGLTVVMFSVDMNIVALALPEMGQAFRQTDEAMSVVILSYLIPLTLLMIPFGLMVTRWQVLTTFLVGITGFALASVLCAFSPSFSMLLIGRALQGTFGALMGTQGVAVVAAVVKPEERGRAMGIIRNDGTVRGNHGTRDRWIVALDLELAGGLSGQCSGEPHRDCTGPVWSIWCYLWGDL